MTRDAAKMSVSEFEDAAFDHTVTEIPDLDVDVFHVGFSLIRAASALQQASEESIHRPSGWSWAGFTVMYILWVLGDLEARSISRFAGVTRQTTSSVLATLERDGLIERERDVTKDRRLVTVRLTPAGRIGVRKAMESQNALEAVWLNALDDDQRKMLGGLLRKVLTHRGSDDPRASEHPRRSA